MSLLNYLLSKKYTDTHNSAASAHGGNIGEVYDTNGAGFKAVWIGTQEEYNVLTPDENTLYFIIEDEY